MARRRVFSVFVVADRHPRDCRPFAWKRSLHRRDQPMTALQPPPLPWRSVSAWLLSLSLCTDFLCGLHVLRGGYRLALPACSRYPAVPICSPARSMARAFGSIGLELPLGSAILSTLGRRRGTGLLQASGQRHRGLALLMPSWRCFRRRSLWSAFRFWPLKRPVLGLRSATFFRHGGRRGSGDARSVPGFHPGAAGASTGTRDDAGDGVRRRRCGCFIEITLPTIWPALFGAFLISFIPAFNNLEISFITSAPFRLCRRSPGDRFASA